MLPLTFIIGEDMEFGREDLKFADSFFEISNPRPFKKQIIFT